MREIRERETFFYIDWRRCVWCYCYCVEYEVGLRVVVVVIFNCCLNRFFSLSRSLNNGISRSANGMN